MIKRKKRKQKQPWKIRQFCPRGHDTFVVGRTKRHNCVQCQKDDRKRIVKERGLGKRTIKSVKNFCLRRHDTRICGRTASGNCKECCREYSQTPVYKKRHNKYMKKYQKKNRKLLLKKSKEYTRKHPDRVKNTNLKKMFNITLEGYNKLLKKQKNRCAGCLKHKSKFKIALGVDHDHKCCPSSRSCGKCIRGLLCRVCNMILGGAFDDPKILRRLANYVGRKIIL